MEFPKNKLIKWAAHIEQYLSSFPDSANNTEPLKAYLDTMADILTEIACRITPNDNWNLFRSGDALEIRSKKLQNSVRFYTWMNIDFNIATTLLFPQHISHMSDEFWKYILELNEYGKFVFEENAIPNCHSCFSVQFPKKVKSNIFRLARHYILFAAQQNGNDIDVEDIYEDFGSIQVSWPLNIKIEDLLNNISEVFTRFYQINYMLYRYEYIINHSKRKGGRKLQTRDEVDKRE
jgi:hypothetical protein